MKHLVYGIYLQKATYNKLEFITFLFFLFFFQNFILTILQNHNSTKQEQNKGTFMILSLYKMKHIQCE